LAVAAEVMMVILVKMVAQVVAVQMGVSVARELQDKDLKEVIRIMDLVVAMQLVQEAVVQEQQEQVQMAGQDLQVELVYHFLFLEPPFIMAEAAVEEQRVQPHY
jgi:hypothetical protein